MSASTPLLPPAFRIPASSPRSALETGLDDALAAAGYQEGEVFELCSILQRLDESKEIQSRRFVRGVEGRAAALAFLVDNDGHRNLYISTNPLASEAGGRAGDVDVTSVRRLLIDLDPENEFPQARVEAREIAEQVHNLLIERIGIAAAGIDSGRGCQIWLGHEPLMGESLAVRRELIHALGARFNRAKAHVDSSTHNPSRLMRFPGSINLRTGERAALLEAGDGKVATLGQIRELVAWLRSLPAESLSAISESANAKATDLCLNPLEILQGVSEGKRDTTLFKYACRLRGKGLDRCEAESLVLVAASNCVPPFPETEARKKIDQAWKYEAPDSDEAVAQARTLVEGLAAKAATDVGAPFEAPARSALALVREKDPAAWVRALAALKLAGVPMGELDVAVRGAQRDARLSMNTLVEGAPITLFEGRAA